MNHWETPFPQRICSLVKLTFLNQLTMNANNNSGLLRFQNNVSFHSVVFEHAFFQCFYATLQHIASLFILLECLATEVMRAFCLLKTQPICLYLFPDLKVYEKKDTNRNKCHFSSFFFLGAVSSACSWVNVWSP